MRIKHNKLTQQNELTMLDITTRQVNMQCKVLHVRTKKD